MTDILNRTEKPRLGEGIFLTSDVAEILQLPYLKLRRWMVELWDNRFAIKGTYSFEENGNRAVNFYTLIEFYTFYQLRLKGVSAQRIQKAHKTISKELNTTYPFASNIRTDGKEIWYDYIDDLVNANGKQQLDIKGVLAPFLHKIDFGKNNMAELYFPIENSRNIVVDPKRQFGQPIVNGTNVRIETIRRLHEGGESSKTISLLYDLKITEVYDALKYYKRAG